MSAVSYTEGDWIEVMVTNPLQVIPPLIDSIILGDFDLEQVVVGHECGQLCGALPPAASNTYRKQALPAPCINLDRDPHHSVS